MVLPKVSLPRLMTLLQGEKPIETNGKLIEIFDNQEDFKYDADPLDVSESDSEYSP